MNDRGWMEPIVERVVGEVLDSHAAQLRSEIVRRVLEELQAELAKAPSTSNPGSVDLARAVAEIQLGASQREILGALLDTCSRYAARVALFVVKGSHASGWQGRGFAENDHLKDFSLDANAPAVGRAIQDRVIVNGPPSEADSRFLEKFGAPASGEIRLLPLVLKDKVAALVYADAGTEAAGKLDAGSLELLVLSTSAWLEVNTLRKQAHKEPAAQLSESHPATVAQASPAYSDPFASHAPGHAHGGRGGGRILRSSGWYRARRGLKPSTRELKIYLPSRKPRLHPPNYRRWRHWKSFRLPNQARQPPPFRPRIRKFIARPSALPACWSMRSSFTTRRGLPKAERTKTFMIV